MLKLKFFTIITTLGLINGCNLLSQQNQQQNWSHFIRTAGHGASLDRINEVFEQVRETHVFGIEIDNSLTGYYESFLHPEEKLKTIKTYVDRAHETGNKIFVYTEGLEIITSNADEKEHTFFKDHPDWVQRDIQGNPAVFGHEAAFWIAEGDEDVWITPYAQEWRAIYMKRIRQIAATGIDGVYVDIPYWMTHFRGWWDTWASFDRYTVEEFQERTGINPMKDMKLGDFNDPHFIEWVDFRITALTDFMKEVDENVKSVNPECMTIPEIYPGIEESAIRVGADVYDMYSVVDVIAHEYSGSGGNAARKNPLDWFSYMTGMYTFRAFAEDKASWMLSYSWDGENEVDPENAMKNLFMAQLMAGTNCWDARGHVMSGSNDYSTRKEVYAWIAEHEKKFYHPRKPIYPIGIYFSPKTRNYFVDEFIESYKGWMYILLQSHLEFQIVTPRTLDDFQGEILILPSVKCICEDEVNRFRESVNSGMSLIISGETGAYDYSRQKREKNPIWEIIGIDKEVKQTVKTEKASALFYPQCPGKKYNEILNNEFNESAYKGIYREESFNVYGQSLIYEIKSELEYKPSIVVTASPFISTHIMEVDGKPHIFMANFKGLKGRKNAVQIPETNAEISLKADADKKVYMLPYLGNPQLLDAYYKDGRLICSLPAVNKGAVVWIE
jgi:hypothetical protein